MDAHRLAQEARPQAANVRLGTRETGRTVLSGTTLKICSPLALLCSLPMSYQRQAICQPAYPPSHISTCLSLIAYHQPPVTLNVSKTNGRTILASRKELLY